MHALEDDEGALRAFVESVPSATSAEDLERLLCAHIGVNAAYVRGRESCARDLGGLRMDPAHLAQFLWFARRVRPHSVLHVGTNHGHSFVAISKFLQGTDDMHTVDEHNFSLTDALPYVLPHRMLRPTRELAGRHYDLVFIESGDPEDYRAVGQYAGVCAWYAPDRSMHAQVSPRQRVLTTYGDIVVLVQKSVGGVYGTTHDETERD